MSRNSFDQPVFQNVKQFKNCLFLTSQQKSFTSQFGATSALEIGINLCFCEQHWNMLGSQNKISRFRHPISIIYETRLSPPAWLSRRKPKPPWWAEEAEGTQAEVPECSQHSGLELCWLRLLCSLSICILKKCCRRAAAVVQSKELL